MTTAAERKRLWRIANKERNAEYQRNYQRRNSARISEYDRQRYAQTKEKRAEQRLERQYGLTKETYEALFSYQNRKCALCFTDGTETRWVVDHCHSSGVVRGILCDPCNLGLGLFKDNLPALERAATYIRNNQCSTT